MSIAPLTDISTGRASKWNAGGGAAVIATAVTHTAELTSDTAVYSGKAIFYGVKVIAAGTSIIVYDNTAASGTRVINGESTATAGAVITPAGAGVGVLMTSGIYLDLTGGTYVVYYIPVA